MDELNKISPITNTNYLEINPRLLPKKSNLSIDGITTIHDTLILAQKTNRLQEIPTNIQDHFVNALRWMKGEVALTQLVSVRQVNGGIMNANNTDINNFNSYLVNLANQFRQYSPYREHEPVILAIQPTLDSATEIINQTAQSREEQLNNSATQRENEIIQNINNTGDSNVGNIRMATKEYQFAGWGAEYEKMITDCQEKLNGKPLLGIFIRNLRSRKMICESNKNQRAQYKDSQNKRIPTVKPIYQKYHIVRNILQFFLIVFSKIKSYNFQRFLWFALLVAVIALSVLDKLFWHQLSKPAENLDETLKASQTLTQYLVYLPFITVFGIGYSFAIKNYRIYNNMLDQYKHRKTVAETARGILGSSDDKLGSEQKNIMAATAAQALFEHKTTGHLSKKEAESGSFLDIVRSITTNK